MKHAFALDFHIQTARKNALASWPHIFRNKFRFVNLITLISNILHHRAIQQVTMSSPGQDWIAMLQRQKQLTINAQGRKGQKPTNKPSRAFLERLFAKKVGNRLALVSYCRLTSEQVDLGKDGHWIRTCFISYAYPPSVTPVSELSPVLISDLVLETHHRGKVLLVRILGYPQRVQAVQNVVEDEKGNVERLGLYNTDPGLVPEFSLPKGAIIAVREPFYKATMDGGYTVRVDHP